MEASSVVGAAAVAAAVARWAASLSAGTVAINAGSLDGAGAAACGAAGAGLLLGDKGVCEMAEAAAFPAAVAELKKKFDIIQLVTTSGIFTYKDDWEKGTEIMTLKDQIDWDAAEYAFLKECESTCNARNAPLRNSPPDGLEVSSN